MLHWMAYGTLVAALLGLAALALERLLQLYGRPVRGVWLGAILLSCVLPLSLPLASGSSAGLEVLSAEGAPGEIFLPSPDGARTAGPAADRSASATDLDTPLLFAWALASLVLSAGLVLSSLLWRRRRRGWRGETVASTRVLVSGDTGPAVVGFLRPEIVLPEWVLDRDEPQRRLIVEHEREHVRAGDPRALLVGFLALVLFPWNAALWWQVRRLRLALEMDCDARILRREPDVRRYGTLLLEVGRLATDTRLPAAAFSEPKSFLERRIRNMTTPRPTRPLRRAALLSMVFALVLTGAAMVPAPEGPDLRGLVGGAEDGGDRPSAVVALDTIRPELKNGEMLARLVRQYHPPLLRNAGISGTAVVRVQVDREGRVTSAMTESATHEAFRDAARRVALQARFSPARAEGRPIPFQVSLPIQFPVDAADAPVAVSPLPPGSGGGAVEITEVSREPKLLNGGEMVRVLQEVYPPLLREAGITGTVLLQMVVDTTGMVAVADAVRPTHEAFGPAAEAAARRMRFSPAEREGRKVPVHFTLPVEFSIPRVGQIGSEAREGGARLSVRSADATSRAEIRAAVERHHPSLLDEEGEKVVWFVVDADGEIVRTGVDERAAASESRVPGLRSAPAGFRDLDPSQIESIELFKPGAETLGRSRISVIWIRLKADAA